jgi:DNA-binding MarR family transcriptional regulator
VTSGAGVDGTSILFDVFALGQRVRVLLQSAMRDAGLRPDDYAVYSVVFEAEQVTLTELARRAHLPVTTAADYVRAMLARGHLARRPNPADQRSHLLVLTADGRRAHRQASRRFERAYQAFVAELGGVDELAARRLLQALTAAAERAALRAEPTTRRRPALKRRSTTGG